jgi:hypothetical protein
MARSYVSSFFFFGIVFALACASGGGNDRDAGPRDGGLLVLDTGTESDSGNTEVDSEVPLDTGIPEDGDVPDEDAGEDVDAGGGVDAGEGVDAGVDSGVDSGTDAGIDAGPSCPGGCNDGVACTVDTCTAAGCTNVANDSLCVAPQTCNATLGCRDASCAESPCRLVSPQCGCPTGEGCYLATDDSRVCAPAGTSTEGQACASDICAAGLICIDVSESTTEVPVCKRFCTSDASCTGGPGSRCVATIGSAGTQICSNHCDVVTQTGCPGNASCSIYETMSGTRLTDCSGPVGTGGQEAACVDDTSCQRGFACINVGGTIPDNRCLRWCRRTAPASGCSGLATCERLGPAPGLVLNGVEYGVCF